MYKASVDFVVKYINKFNRILVFKSDMLDNNSIRVIRQHSKDDSEYYFNIIRIYYYNFYHFYKKYEESRKYNNFDQEAKKDEEQVKKSCEEQEKEDENSTELDIKEPRNSKKSDNPEEPANPDSDDPESDNPEEPTNPEIKEQQLPDNEQQQFGTSKNPNYHYDAENFINNFDIKYKSDLQKKIYKYIILRTHPDKTDEELLHYVFIDATFFFEENDIAILFIIAIALGYKCKKLTKQDKKQLDQNITKYIIKKKTYLSQTK